MPELESRETLRLPANTVRRIFAFVRPRRLGTADTAFEVGYERAKQDLMDILGKDYAEASAGAEKLLRASGSKEKGSLLQRLMNR